MISVTVHYTANLGPEAEIPALLRKLAIRLREATPGDDPVLAGAVRIAEYVTSGDDDWASAAGVLSVPAAEAERFRAGVLGDLFTIADNHFTGLYARRSIAVSFEFTPVAADNLIERRHHADPAVDSF
jgi:5-carboxymethyl-2-hydroxymuconate isomerase